MTDLPSPPQAGNYLTPAWQAFRVPVFGGRETRVGTGTSYLTATLRQIFTMKPSALPKIDGPGFIPSRYCEHDARTHKVQREHGQFVALTGDVDHGDHPLKVVEEVLRAFVANAAWLIHASPSARPGYRKWRVIIPLASPVHSQTWQAAQTLFHDYLAAAKIEPDRSLARPGQIVFAPNVPAVHDQSGTALREGATASGAPLYFERSHSDLNAPGLDLIGGEHATDINLRIAAAEAEETERSEAATEAARKRKDRAGSGSTPIERFNAANDVAGLLARYGYADCPSSDLDWQSPHQNSGSYATRICTDAEGREYWVSLSGSDTAAGLGAECLSGRHGDAFELFVHYEHGGDVQAALEALRLADGVNDFAGVVFPPEEPATTAEGAASAMRWAQSGDDYDPDAACWLIPDRVPAGGTGFLSGVSQSGKTFLLYHLAAALGGQTEFYGEKPEAPCSTIILQSENFDSGRRRLRAIDVARGDGAGPLPIHVADAGGFGNTAERAAMLVAIEERVAMIAALGQPRLGLIAIDTLSASRLLSEENSNDSASEAVAFMSHLSRRFGCFVIVLHHPPKNGDGLRGGGALLGNVDMALQIKRAEKAPVREVECVKQRDGEQGIWGSFTLPTIVIGARANGRQVVSCTVSTSAGLAPTSTVPSKGAQTSALAILGSLKGSGGPVTFGHWLDVCADGDEVSTAAAPRDRRDTCRRAILALIEKALVTCEGSGENATVHLAYAPVLPSGASGGRVYSDLCSCRSAGLGCATVRPT